MYFRFIPLAQSFDTFGLVYSVSREQQNHIFPGSIVKIPFRESESLAIYVGPISETEIHFDETNIKDIVEILPSDFSLSREQILCIEFISERYICLIHHAANLYFPKNLKEKLLKNTYHKIKDTPYEYENICVELNAKQQQVFDTIVSSDKKKFLLFGVTGSGKTEIYIKLIEENLKSGKQSLLLIPEIILTSQIGERLQKHFGKSIIILNSSVSSAKKTQYWKDIHTGSAKIIIGTRSALFFPYNNLGSIIIDEEHDESYVSDQTPRYHARDLAEKMSELYDIPLILASGTPKVTTFYKSLIGEYTILQLLEKYKDLN